MKATKITCFPVKVAAGKVKANGVVTLEDTVELKYALMQGPKEIFISWNGGKAFETKDGKKGWDSPIKILDEAFNKKLTEEVLAKYSSLTRGGGASASASSAPAYDDSFTSDDIPF